MSLSPGITSSSSALLLARPTFKGMTVPGKTTMLRIGRIGSKCGRTVRCPLAPVRIVVAVGVRSMIWDSAILGYLDPQHSIAIRGGDLFSRDVGRKLDLAAEGAVIDLHQMDPHAFGLSL